MKTTATLRTAAAGLALATAGTLLPLGIRPAAAAVPNTVAVTVRLATNGAGGQLAHGATGPRLSANGRFAAFSVTADASDQVWVEDLLSGHATLVSRTPAGTPGDGFSEPIAVSDDGKRVAFLSSSTNLAPAPKGKNDLYIRDLAANTTTRVNVLQGGAEAEVLMVEVDVDAGLDAVTWSDATQSRIWYRNLTTKQTQRVDVASDESAGNDFGGEPRVSGDGTHVAFTSDATNLVTGDTNAKPDVFVRDINAGTTVRASLGSVGNQLTTGADHPAISATARYVTFESTATLAVPNDTNGNQDVFRRDLAFNSTTRVSVNGVGAQLDRDSSNGTLSSDGLVAIFGSYATNLPGAGPASHLYERHLASATTTLLDRAFGGTAGNNQPDDYFPSISHDGAVAAYQSPATNLVGGDTNGAPDAFVLLPESMGPHATLGQLSSAMVGDFGAPIQATNTFTDQLQNGRTTVTHLIAGLAHAPAFAKDREPVARLYVAFFGRKPDPSGLTYWVNKHAKGTDLGAIATKFAASSEFKTKYGNVNATDFVKLVYTNVLKRQADSTGLAHWVSKMNQGMSRGQVMVQFSESSEGVRRLAPIVVPVLISLGMLHRLPTASELSGAGAAYAAGGDEGVAEWFLDSDAYAATI